MRLLHCADLHIGAGAGGEDVFSGVAYLNMLADAALAQNADLLLICGDLFDRNARGATGPGFAAGALARLRKAGVRVLAIEGNHDCKKEGRQETPLEILHRQNDIELLRPGLDETNMPLLPPYGENKGCVWHGGGVRIIGLGYFAAQARAQVRMAALRMEPYAGCTVCMLHAGVYPEPAIPPLGGLRPEDMRLLSGKAQYLALGHRHAKEEGVDWYNPGSPNGVRMNNPLAQRGYYIVDIEGKDVAHTFHGMQAGK